MQLYWVSTRDGDEDWFVIATNSHSACKFHESFEGYLPGDAKAKLICEVKKNYSNENAYHAQLDMIEDLGFKVLSSGPTRIVIKEGKTYREGTTINSVVKQNTEGKEILYILKINGENKYKIGITRYFNKRVTNLQTGNPYIIDVWNYYETKNSKKIEKTLHQRFKHKHIGGEWYELDSKDLNLLNEIISFLIK